MTAAKYIAAQNAFIANFDLKKGDIVKVIRTAKDEEAGWNNVWDSSSMKPSSKELTIKSFSGAYGISLSDNFDYPYFALEFVRKGNNLFIELDSGDYTAEVSPDGKTVNVGCQKVSYDTIYKIHTAMLNAQKEHAANPPKKLAKKVPAKKVARR